MIFKVDSYLPTLFLLMLFVIQTLASSQADSEKLAELTERVDKWQGKMEALEAENVELKSENIKLKTSFKKLKLKVENLEKIIQLKQEESCEQVEPKVSFTKKKRSPESNKKNQNISNKNTKALAKPLPTTCAELRARGHFADGIYLLADPDTNQINAYSCEFLSATDSVETSIGNVQLKTDTVHFFVQRETSFSNLDTNIPFERETLNVGKAMNPLTGVFRAPVAGIYHFEFCGLTSDKLNVVLRKNGDNVALTAAELTFTNGDSFYTSISLATSLQLNVGETVSLYKNGDGTLYQGALNVPNTHFAGWLVVADDLPLPQVP